MLILVWSFAADALVSTGLSKLGYTYVNIGMFPCSSSLTFHSLNFINYVADKTSFSTFR